MKKAIILPFFFFLLLAFAFLLVAPVRAEGDVSLTDFPTKLAEQLGIDVFAGKILASVIILLLFLLPCFLLTRSQPAHLIVGMAGLGFCIAMGWLPIYIFAIIGLLIAFGFTKMIGKHL